MLERSHEGQGAAGRGREGTGGSPYDLQALFRAFDDALARPWTEEDSERLLDRVLGRIQHKRRRRQVRRLVALAAAVMLVVWFSFRVLAASGLSGPRL
jgi:hypothetical protein